MQTADLVIVDIAEIQDPAPRMVIEARVIQRTDRGNGQAIRILRRREFKKDPVRPIDHRGGLVFREPEKEWRVPLDRNGGN